MFIAVLSLLLPLLACQRTPTPEDDKLRILTSIAPLYSFTKNIAGDAAHVDNLIPSGAGPHEYALSPGDAQKVEKSHILFINGVKLESWLKKLTGFSEKPGQAAGTGKEKLIVVDTSEGVTLIGQDPHIWLSPMNAIVQVKNIRDALIKADPDNSELYAVNSDAYIRRLRDLDREIRDETASWNTRSFVSFHPAFLYFAREYGLELAAVIQETPDTEPSPRHIADVIETIREAGIKSIFTEMNASHKIVESIAKDLNLEIYSLDTLETGPLSSAWYEDRMRSNLKIFKKALN